MSGLLCSQRLGVASCSFAGTRLSPPAAPQQAAPRCSLTVSAGMFGPGKKWESYPLTKNGKPQRQPMHVKTGDTVQVIAGSDKGKVGKVTKVLPKTGQVVVEGVNIKFRTVKPRAEGETGQITQQESTIHHSNVMHYSQEQNVRSRVAHKIVDGKKVRFLRKTGEVIDRPAAAVQEQ